MTVNNVLREYVTNIGFAMSLSKTQVRLLVLLKHFGGFDKWCKSGHLRGGDYTTPFHALERRGLVTVTPGDRADGTGDHVLTRAGELVIELLKEAGIYQDCLRQLDIETAA